MGFCYELNQGCCGCPIHSTVMTAFCHYTIYGLFALIFVFTNNSYPAIYFVDYMFAGSGGALSVTSIIAGSFANSRKCQPIRFILAFVIVANVLVVVVSTYYYTIERWNDVMVTALTGAIRHSKMRDYPDFLWYFLVVISCINCPVLLIYLIYILSYMCNEWKSYLFSDPYQNWVVDSPFTPTLTVPRVPPSYAYPADHSAQQ